METKEPTNAEVKSYEFQHIVDSSPKLEVTRTVNTAEMREFAKELLNVVEELETLSAPTVSWEYRCSPPEVIRQGNSNAPAYLPVKPKDVASQVRWMVFHGLPMAFADMLSQTTVRSRLCDKDCRSADLTKFDEETFITKQTWANDPMTKVELEDLRNKFIENFGNGVDMYGNKLVTPEDYTKAHQQFIAIGNRIKAKSRTSE